MLALRHLAIRRGSRLLFAQLDAVFHAGWKVGVVGRNGCGKSSLLAAIQGELDPDQGHIDLPGATHIAAVAQQTPALPDAAIDYVIGGDAVLAEALARKKKAEARDDGEALSQAHQHLEAIDGYTAHARAGKLLYGLGFATETHTRPVAEFSGGWRGRLNLARALMAPSNLLLLDEPTNHLDMDAIIWLENWLKHYQGMLLVISHDREFLDHVTSHILHLGQGKGCLYTGHYSDFERQYAEKLQQQQRTHEREKAERTHLEAFVRRFQAKATKAKQAQSRIKRLQKLAGTEAVRSERPFHFQFVPSERLPQSMLSLTRAQVGYKADHPVLRELALSIQAGDRIGLLGANGAGKSTLVKSMVGQLPLLQGTHQIHPDLGIGYFAQHTVESLIAGESPLDHLKHIAGNESSQTLRDWLGQWQFVGDKAVEPVDTFSGGERARLALALIAWQKPGLLLLDEPTNHLDVEMRQSLADALNDYPGALVLVSHDRYLSGLVCDCFWHIADGKVTPFDGDLDDYAVWLERSRRENVAATVDKKTSSHPMNARERRREAAQKREQTRTIRKQCTQLEKELEKVDARLQAIDAELADPETYENATAYLADLGKEQGKLRQQKQSIEDEWLMISEQLEQA